MISYIEDKNLIARCVKLRKWDLINSANFTSLLQIHNGDREYAVVINDIPPLSILYGGRYVSVSFAFKNISREFSEEDEAAINQILSGLQEYMQNTDAYFVIKIPTHITSLMSSISTRPLGMFAGGTVCYMHSSEPEQVSLGSVEVHKLEKPDLVKHEIQMINLGIDGFKDYFGQYHIIKYTRLKAGKIYENWVREYVQEKRGITFGAFKGNELVGFLSCDDFGSELELVLSAVSTSARGMRVYESMIRASTAYGFANKQDITVSTQFDNFEVQRAWINVGFKPYYSFYLYHYNSLRDKVKLQASKDESRG